jgi:hypothetical protein
MPVLCCFCTGFYIAKNKEENMPDNNYVEFNIYFSDLNEDAQKRLMEVVGITDPKEMNWDIDMCPIAVYSTESTEKE